MVCSVLLIVLVLIFLKLDCVNFLKINRVGSWFNLKSEFKNRHPITKKQVFVKFFFNNY
jgi:hypothetical protein